MAKDRFAIDSVKCCRTDGDLKLNIRGWCTVDEKDDYTLVLYSGNQKPIKIVESRVSRKDVVKALLPKYQIVETKGIGFIIFAELKKQEADQGIQLLAEHNGKEIPICQYEAEELYKLTKEDLISYSIDRMDLEKGKIILEGWAVSLDGTKLEYEISDDCGGKLEFEEKRVARTDISRMFLGEEFKYIAGFRIKFVDIKSPVYHLKFKRVDEVREVEIQRKQIFKEVNKRKKRYSGISDIFKGITGKRLIEDIKTLLIKGPAAVKKEWRSRYTNEEYQYDLWYRRQEPDKQKLEEQKKERFPFMPKISLIVPAYHTPAEFLKQMIDSVQRQSYENWELCIADGGAEDSVVEAEMRKYLKKESRIRYVKLEKNEGISGNTNRAIELATGDFYGLLDHDDILAPDALHEIVAAANRNPGAEVFYTDEDKVSMDLKTYFCPHFKSDYNRDLLRSNNYICHLFVVKKEIVDKVGFFNSEYDGSQDYDFILRCTEAAKQIIHIPKVLYHWRMHQASTAADPESKMYCFEAGRKAIEAHLKRCGVEGAVEMFPDYLGFYQVHYQLHSTPKISIIIPNKDEAGSLRTCINSILKNTDYPDYEIIIVENNSVTKEIFEYYKELEKESRIKIITWSGEFNYSAINNFGVQAAEGDYILLLNNDTEVLKKDWLRIMAADLQREDIGAVGVKLYYPDMTLQHCGVIIGLGGVAGHVYTGLPGDYMGDFGRAQLQQDISAVTAACMMVKRDVYEAVGGFDENIKVAFNDVDFCLKIREKGYRIMYEPLTALKHYESKSRGKDDTEEKQLRFQREVDYMKRKWKKVLEQGDPYYNKNKG